jgi:hypothetical protein
MQATPLAFSRTATEDANAHIRFATLYPTAILFWKQY